MQFPLADQRPNRCLMHLPRHWLIANIPMGLGAFGIESPQARPRWFRALILVLLSVSSDQDL